MKKSSTWQFGLLMVLLVAVSCTKNSDGQAASSPSVTSAPTTAPPPQKPKNASQARLEGRYKVAEILVTTQIPQKGKPDRSTWRTVPLCKKGGGCDSRITSTNRWSDRAAYLAGRYRWSRTIKKLYTCGSPGNIDYYITGIYDYDITIDKMALVRDEWVGASFDGTLIGRATRGCGFSMGSNVWEKWTIHGTLVR